METPVLAITSRRLPMRASAYLQSSYIDASQIAFGALSGKLAALGFNLGDYGLAVRHDQNLQSGFYFADRGGNNYKLGECSHKVGKNLGGSGRGNRFNNNYPVSFIVFPGSGNTDPAAVPSIADADIQTAVRPLLANLATADDAKDLVLLMAFNETSPPNKPAGHKQAESLSGAADHYHAQTCRYCAARSAGLWLRGIACVRRRWGGDGGSQDSGTPPDAVA